MVILILRAQRYFICGKAAKFFYFASSLGSGEEPGTRFLLYLCSCFAKDTGSIGASAPLLNSILVNQNATLFFVTLPFKL